MVYEIPVKEITKENFSAFGKYFNEKGSAPTFSDTSFDWWNEVGLVDIKGGLSFGVVQPRYNAGFSERAFERHSRTPEILIPMDEDIIVLVGKRDTFSGKRPEPEDFEAFLAPRGTAVCIGAGVWHHAPMVTGVSSRVFVIYREKTASEDNTVKDLSRMDLTVKVIPPGSKKSSDLKE